MRLSGVFGLLALLLIFPTLSYGAEKKETYHLVYEMKVVKFWNITVNWRNQEDYPVAGKESKELYKKVTKEIKKDQKTHSLLRKTFVLR